MTMSIMPLLRSTGGLPLNELSLRSSGSYQEVIEELAALVKQGLVEVDGDLPADAQQLRLSRSLVKLTRAGTRRLFS
jgi:hypothetical protein